jgi:hypothetical protein
MVLQISWARRRTRMSSSNGGRGLHFYVLAIGMMDVTVVLSACIVFFFRFHLPVSFTV